MTYRDPGEPAPAQPLPKCANCTNDLLQHDQSKDDPNLCWSCDKFLKSGEPAFEYATLRYYPDATDEDRFQYVLEAYGRQGYDLVNACRIRKGNWRGVRYLFKRKRVVRDV